MGAEYPTMRKDSSDVLDYSFNWEDWLEDGDFIVNSTWTVNGSGLTIENSPAPSIDKYNDDAPDNSLTKCWLSGGTVNTIYTLTNTIVTDGGRTTQSSMFIRIVEK